MNLEQRLRALLRSRFLRFGAVGAAGFVVDLTVLWLMLHLAGFDPYSSRIVSIFCAMTFTWWGNRNLTFAEHAATGSGAEIAREWFKFMLANGLGALINYATYSLFVRFAPPPFSNPLVATAIGVGVGLIFNFVLSKRFVFRAK
ncbi:MAG TPA: GtrA family protein [Rhizomicrobium sp.]|nr:GtrA family protein [Rhizomicrobium sp.]